MSHGCIMGVSQLSQGCSKFQGCSKGFLWAFQGCFLKDVLRVFQSIFKEVSRVIQGCFMGFMGVLRVFQRCFKISVTSQPNQPLVKLAMFL